MFDILWSQIPIRLLGVKVSDINENVLRQLSLFSEENIKVEKLDYTIDNLREKYGNDIILRGSLLNTKVKPITGKIGGDEYPVMRSQI